MKGLQEVVYSQLGTAGLGSIVIILIPNQQLLEACAYERSGKRNSSSIHISVVWLIRSSEYINKMSLRKNHEIL